jgi:polyisoprenoid-binding protein YceI
MKKLIVAMLLLLPFSASAVEYSKVQADRSSIGFVSRQMNVPVEGVFKKFAAELRFNPAKPETGMARIDIELASIDAGSVDANDEVRGKSWFNVAEFPRATFVTSAVKALGAGKFEATGKMTIKGKTLEMRAPFTLKEDKGVLNIDGVFVLKRLDFGIGSGLWSDTSVVADEVQIKFNFVVK